MCVYAVLFVYVNKVEKFQTNSDLETTGEGTGEDEKSHRVPNTRKRVIGDKFCTFVSKIYTYS